MKLDSKMKPVCDYCKVVRRDNRVVIVCTNHRR